MICRTKKILFVTSHDLLESHLMNHFDYSTLAFPQQSPIIYLKEIKSKQRSRLTSRLKSDSRFFLLNTGFGQTEAAISLATCLAHKKFDAVIGLGFAGALDPDLKIGDVLVIDDLFQYDFKMIKNNKESLLPAERITNIPAECQLSQAYMATHDSHKIFQALKNHKEFAVSRGTLISGNEFIANKARSTKMMTRYPQATAVDMEAAAISLTAKKFKIPFNIVKIIANNLHCSRTEADEQFERYQSSISHYALPLVNSLSELYSQNSNSSIYL